MSFNIFSLHSSIIEGIQKVGYNIPTAIQKQAIPAVMKGCDVIGLAQTGTGKTAAFILPILHRLTDAPKGRVGALVIAPTRELAEQIHSAFEMLGSKTCLRSAVVYGGVSIHSQIQALKQADIVVGCPGRLLDHIGRKTIDLSALQVLVLDEADQMCDMGFFPDIRRILSHVPQYRHQTLLFSATMPDEIRKLTDDILKKPVTVQAGALAPPDTVRHAMYPVASHLKTALLIRLIGDTLGGSVLVFARTKYRAKSLGEKLSRAGFRSTSLQGNLSQNQRRTALERFRSGDLQILVATDIAARGLDVPTVSHVINYDIPDTPEAYIHRIGRTGRAQRTGDAFTLITEEDIVMVKAIHKTLGGYVEKRTVADFKYGCSSAIIPPYMPDKKPSHSPRRTHTSDKKNAHNSTSKNRSAKGAFSMFSPKH